MRSGTIYDSFPTLATARLVLRTLQPSDSTAIFQIGCNHAVMRWYDLDTFTMLDDASAFIARQQHRFAQQRGVRWGLALRQTDQIIGWCGHAHVPYHRMELGYALAEPYWRQGFMREALQAIIPFTFAHMDVNRLEATVHVDNVASRGLLEHLGFIAEGILRDYGFWRGHFHTLTMYALLRHEYRQTAAPQLCPWSANDFA